MPNKVEQSLSLTELRAMLEELAALSATPTLKQIQEAAAARGVKISLMGATSVRDKNFEGLLAELRRKREVAEAITAATESGGTASDAAAALGSDLILDQLVRGELEGEALDRAMLTISRLRKGNQAAAKLRTDLDLAAQRIAKFEVEATERAEKKAALLASLARATGSDRLQPATLKKLEEELRLL